MCKSNRRGFVKTTANHHDTTGTTNDKDSPPRLDAPYLLALLSVPSSALRRNERPTHHKTPATAAPAKKYGRE